MQQFLLTLGRELGKIDISTFKVDDEDDEETFTVDIVQLVLLLTQLHCYCRKLHSLYFNHCLDDAGVLALMNLLPQITCITLMSCYKISSVGFAVLGQQCSNLQRLCIQYTNICDKGLIAIGNGCSNLKYLKLAYNPYVSKSAISSALMKLGCLTELQLYDIDTVIAGTISGCLPRLVYLTICKENTMSDADMRHLFNGCPALRGVNLGQVSALTNAGICHIRNLNFLKCFKNDHITDAAGVILGRNNPELQQLTVEGFSRLTGAFVLDLLRECSSLEALTVQRLAQQPEEVHETVKLLGKTLKQLFPQLKRLNVCV